MDVRKNLRTLVGPVFVIVVFVAALWLLHAELKQYDLRDFGASVARIPTIALILAVGLTILDYGILALYEFLGQRYVRHTVSPGRVVLASILGYALGHNFGVLLGGSTVRYRLYTAWGLSAFDVVRLMLFLWVTFAVGLSALGGLVFLIEPLPIPSRLHLPLESSRVLGVVLCSGAVGYLLLCAVRRSPVRIRSLDFSPPSPGLGALQGIVAAADLMVAAAVLYMLLPASTEVGYVRVLAIYLLAIVATFMSQVPGGVGVLELVVILLLKPPEPQAVFSSLLVYRVVFYLLPLSFALLLLSFNELSIHGARARQLVAALGRWPSLEAPRLMTLAVFISGAFMLFSSVTPSPDERVQSLLQVLPLGLVEVAHFALSVTGALLLVLTRGLQRRLTVAYWLTTVLLATGVACALLKGLSYQESLLFAGLLVLMLPTRRDFYRRRTLVAARFSATWFIAFTLAVACTVWLMQFAHRNLDYRHELWWQFGLDAEASRSLRAMAGMILVILLVACVWLLRAKPRRPGLATREELDIIRPLVEHAPHKITELALRGDRHLLIHGSGKAFLAFGVEGRSWIALGDPVGDELGGRELARDFRELCDEFGSWPVFYRVSEERLSVYVEMGLALVKVGEEARVPLDASTLDSETRHAVQRTFRRLSGSGLCLDILEAPAAAEVVQELRQLSGNWLSEAQTAGQSPVKSFWSEEFRSRSGIARVRRGDEILAFAVIWQGAGNWELTIDRIRYRPACPPGVRDFLTTSLMLWGKNQGYQFFNLGLAPPSGTPVPSSTPLWQRLVASAPEHGETFANLEALRADKDKYGPVWVPEFLATPSGFKLPQVLTNVATLLARGRCDVGS